MTIAEKLVKVAENTEPVCTAVRVVQTKASGSVVVVGDVSSVEHPVVVELDLPLTDITSQLVDGLYNDDYSLTTTGYHKSVMLNLSPGEYTLRFDREVTIARTGLNGTMDWSGSAYTEYNFTVNTEGLATYFSFALYDGANIQVWDDSTTISLLSGGFAGTTLTRYGKNFLDMSSLIGTSKTANGGTLSVGDDGGITGSGTPTGGVELPYVFIQNPPLTTLTFSRSGTFKNITCSVFIRNGATNLTSFTLAEYSTQRTKTLNLADYPTATNILFNIKRNNNNTEMSGTMYLQCEPGSTATEHEKGKAPTAYPVNADGTVDGVTSLTPSMTLTTDNAGAVINCRYFPGGAEDTQRAYNELTQAIQELRYSITT